MPPGHPITPNVGAMTPRHGDAQRSLLAMRLESPGPAQPVRHTLVTQGSRKRTSEMTTTQPTESAVLPDEIARRLVLPEGHADLPRCTRRTNGCATTCRWRRRSSRATTLSGWSASTPTSKRSRVCRKSLPPAAAPRTPVRTTRSCRTPPVTSSPSNSSAAACASSMPSPT